FPVGRLPPGAGRRSPPWRRWSAPWCWRGWWTIPICPRSCSRRRRLTWVARSGCRCTRSIDSLQPGGGARARKRAMGRPEMASPPGSDDTIALAFDAFEPEGQAPPYPDGAVPNCVKRRDWLLWLRFHERDRAARLRRLPRGLLRRAIGVLEAAGLLVG